MTLHASSHTELNQDFFDFVAASPTAFHAVTQMAETLNQAGFERLLEHQPWHLRQGGCYYVTRNDSSLIVFRMGQRHPADTGFRLLGAHTDSPCLKIKPNPERIQHSYLQLGVEVYGGALLNPWFDRDLSMAGRITWLSPNQTLQSNLIDFKTPVAVISSLAIHLDREANKNRGINAQKDLPPIIMQIPPETARNAHNNGHDDFHHILLHQLETEHAQIAERILAHEICLYDTQPPTFLGMHQEFIAGGRLDNLLSCYIGLRSFIEADIDKPDISTMLVYNDHEEVGSLSASGAQGPFLTSVLQRICPAPEEQERIRARSILISADNAHGIHPNYADKFDPQHAPLLNQGPVIKINANQRYASTSETIALFRYLCEQASVPFQEFVVRSDMPCGSTIGPLTAGATGIKTVDIGVPTFGMHSIRELAGVWDTWYLYQVLGRYWNMEIVLNSAFS
jgi:aspartyl aminopeptidase